MLRPLAKQRCLASMKSDSRTTGSTAGGGEFATCCCSNADAREQNRVTSMVQTGVIVSFIADGLLLTVIASILACVSGLLLLSLRFASTVQRFHARDLLAQPALLRDSVLEQLAAGELIPVRCSIPPSHSVRSAPLDRFRNPVGGGLRGWQSDGR